MPRNPRISLQRIEIRRDYQQLRGARSAPRASFEDRRGTILVTCGDKRCRVLRDSLRASSTKLGFGGVGIIRRIAKERGVDRHRCRVLVARLFRFAVGALFEAGIDFTAVELFFVDAPQIAERADRAADRSAAARADRDAARQKGLARLVAALRFPHLDRKSTRLKS